METHSGGTNKISLALTERGTKKETEPVFPTFKEPRNRLQGIDSASLCRMRAGTTTLFLLGS